MSLPLCFSTLREEFEYFHAFRGDDNKQTEYTQGDFLGKKVVAIIVRNSTGNFYSISTARQKILTDYQAVLDNLLQLKIKLKELEPEDAPLPITTSARDLRLLKLSLQAQEHIVKKMSFLVEDLKDYPIVLKHQKD